MTNDLHNAEEVPSLKLSSDELLHIASFLTSDNDDNNRDRDQNRNRQINLRAKILILMMKMRKNLFIRQQCVERLKNWHSCVKKEACDILSMVGVCSAWRRELTCSGDGGDDGVTDTLLWKPLYHQVFCPDMRRLYGNRFLKERVGLTYFSLFQLMIKVKRKLSSSSQKQEREHTDGDEQQIAVLRETNLDDVTVLVNAQYKQCKYFTRQYVGIGKMNKDQIVEIHMPSFGDLCDMGKYRWWKEASELCEKKTQNYIPRIEDIPMLYVSDVLQARGNPNDDPNDEDYWERNADDLIWTENAEKRSSFPTVSIFIVKNSNSILKKIYSGKPKWRFRDEDHVESYGPMPDIYDQGSIAHLFDSVHLAVQCDDKLMVTHDSPSGLYSDEQLDKYMGYDDEEYYDSEDEEYYGEERKDLNDEEFVALRKKDVMSFVSGPK